MKHTLEKEPEGFALQGLNTKIRSAIPIQRSGLLMRGLKQHSEDLLCGRNTISPTAIPHSQIILVVAVRQAMCYLISMQCGLVYSGSE